jgi:hypothetical protein
MNVLSLLGFSTYEVTSCKIFLSLHGFHFSHKYSLTLHISMY